ncbi:hypothetical protein CDAR_189921 [Caerostris darwini]|uniref:Uncharacterized protein n=1 Tax=Caerostris darwini TaxID=1538125 RepID=A0AAV4QT71_9ARAC|nr:hypothetical protein CDAR_189921 [Caerostris darwini]
MLPPMDISLSLSDEGDDVRIEFFAESEETELKEKLTIVTYWKFYVIDTIGGVVDEKRACILIISQSNATEEINKTIHLTERSKLMAKKDIYLCEDTLIIKCILTIPSVSKIVYDSYTSEEDVQLAEDVQQLTSQDIQELPSQDTQELPSQDTQQLPTHDVQLLPPHDVQQTPTRIPKGVRRNRRRSSQKEKKSSSPYSPSKSMTWLCVANIQRESPESCFGSNGIHVSGRLRLTTETRQKKMA